MQIVQESGGENTTIYKKIPYYNRHVKRKMYKTDKTMRAQTGRTVGKDKYCRFLKKVQVFSAAIGELP